MEVMKGYRFRIYPDEQQKVFFKQTFGCVRFTYNQLLMMRKKSNHAEESMKITPASLKSQYPFLKQTDSLALANAQRNLERAYTNFFQGRAGYPKLKSKKNSWQSYTTNNQKHTIFIKDGYLKLPKLKTLIKIHEHRELKGQIKSVAISAKNHEEFYASILCLEKVEELPKTKQFIALTYCPDQLVTLSKQVATRALLNEEAHDEKLAREKRRLELRAKLAKKRHVRLSEAKNYQKQKKRVTKLFVEKSARKHDFMDQLSYQIVKEFDYLFVEKHPPDVKGTVAFTKADWYTFIQKVKYKSTWYGKEYLGIDLHTEKESRSDLLEAEGLRLLDKR